MKKSLVSSLIFNTLADDCSGIVTETTPVGKKRRNDSNARMNHTDVD